MIGRGHLPDFLLDDAADRPTAPPKAPRREAVNVNRLRRLLRERAARRYEALRLYQPTPMAAQIHACMAPEVVVEGSNRAGKTVACAAELAYIATSSHPIREKYPLRDGIAYIVGFDGDHLGRTIFKKLFKKGAFRIIRDLTTGKWRPWMPNDPSDAARKKESRPAPPLIPARYIKKINYEKKGEEIPSSIHFRNGWIFYFHSSKSHPEQGTDIDLLYMDEGLEDETWYVEGSARLVDRCGRMLWSATEQDISEALTLLHKRAEECANDPEPAVKVFKLLSQDNPYLPHVGLSQFIGKLTDEQYDVRVAGNSAMSGVRIFPQFLPDAYDFTGEDSFVKDGIPPPDWCNFAIIDPGFNPCAVLFASIPPPEAVKKHGNIVVLWDEIYQRRCTVGAFGDAFAEKAEGVQFEAFIIDAHGAVRAKDFGTGENLLLLFQGALEERGIRSRTTYSGFAPGSNDVRARLHKGQEWMKPHPPHGAKVRIIAWKMKNFISEAKAYRFKRRPDGTVDDMPFDRNDHLMDCLCMLAQYDPKYVQPPKPEAPQKHSPAFLDHMKDLAREEREGNDIGGSRVRFGPTGPGRGRGFDDDFF